MAVSDSQCLVASRKQTGIQRASLPAGKSCEGVCTWLGRVCEPPKRQWQISLLLPPSLCFRYSVWNQGQVYRDSGEPTNISNEGSSVGNEGKRYQSSIYWQLR